MHQFLPYAWFQNQCVPFEEAKISIATHALHYGTGAFGGMRAIPDPQQAGTMLLFRADVSPTDFSSQGQGTILLARPAANATTHPIWGEVIAES